jgi:hypothetical protein
VKGARKHRAGRMDLRVSEPDDFRTHEYWVQGSALPKEV